MRKRNSDRKEIKKARKGENVAVAESKEIDNLLIFDTKRDIPRVLRRVDFIEILKTKMIIN